MANISEFTVARAEIQGAVEVEQLQDRSRCPRRLKLARLLSYKSNVDHYEGYVSSPIAQLSDMHTMLRIPYVHPRAKLQCRTISAPFVRATLMYDWVTKRKSTCPRMPRPFFLIDSVYINSRFYVCLIFPVEFQ